MSRQRPGPDPRQCSRVAAALTNLFMPETRACTALLPPIPDSSADPCPFTTASESFPDRKDIVILQWLACAPLVDTNTGAQPGDNKDWRDRRATGVAQALS